MKTKAQRARKEYLEVPFEVKVVREDGTFEGYASLFDKSPDSYGDLIAPGAFTNTLKKGGRNGTGIPILWQHRSDEPIGPWDDLHEDSKGLFGKGTLDLDIPEGRRAYSGMKKNYVKGLSIGYNSVVEEYDKNTKLRTLKEIELWEISIVTFPAKTSAQVTVVKALEDARTPREMEDILREAGLTRTEAKFVVSRMRFSGQRDAEPEEGSLMEDLLGELRQYNLGQQ